MNWPAKVNGIAIIKFSKKKKKKKTFLRSRTRSLEKSIETFFGCRLLRLTKNSETNLEEIENFNWEKKLLFLEKKKMVFDVLGSFGLGVDPPGAEVSSAALFHS